jgi:uncharacterized protein (DUF58 family)
VFGSATRTKSELTAEITSLLAMTAIRNQDKIGCILFSDRIVKSIPPRKGRTAVMRLVREVLAAGETRHGTDIAGAIRFLNNVQKRRAVVFVVSDFQDTGYDRALRALARHHDVIACPVSDPRESTLPNVGLVQMQDPETGELVIVDTASRTVRDAFAAEASAVDAELHRNLRRWGIDTLDVSTGRPYIDDVRALFQRRRSRARRSS